MSKTEPKAPTRLELLNAPARLVPLVLSLVAQVDDQSAPKYKNKLINCYINNSLKYIRDDAYPAEKRFKVLISLLVFSTLVGRMEAGGGAERGAEAASMGEKLRSRDFSEVLSEITTFICEKKILMVRALVLDLVHEGYSEDREYRAKEEKWIRDVESDIARDVPLGLIKDSGNAEAPKTKVSSIEEIGSRARQGPAPQEPYSAPDLAQCIEDLASDSVKYVLLVLSNSFAGEMRGMFVAKNAKLGKSGNQLIINILHYGQFVQRYIDYKAETHALANAIREGFANKANCEEIGYLEDMVRR